MKEMKIGKLNLVCEGTERDDLVEVAVAPDSSDEKWLCNELFPKFLKNPVVIHLGVLFDEPVNKYLLTPEDYKTVEPFIKKRKFKKEIAVLTAECVGMAVGSLLMYYICEAIKHKL